MTVHTIKPLVMPFRISVDTREQAPYHFTGIMSDLKNGCTRNGVRYRRPVVVHTVPKALKTGDYSIDGLEDEITIERKSLGDAFNSFGQDRDRFVRELERMQQMQWSAVIIEGSRSSVLKYKPQGADEYDVKNPGKRFTGKKLIKTVRAWDVRYATKWHYCESKFLAEREAFGLLVRYWIERERKMES